LRRARPATSEGAAAGVVGGPFATQDLTADRFTLWTHAAPRYARYARLSAFVAVRRRSRAYGPRGPIYATRRHTAQHWPRNSSIISIGASGSSPPPRIFLRQFSTTYLKRYWPLQPPRRMLLH